MVDPRASLRAPLTAESPLVRHGGSPRWALGIAAAVVANLAASLAAPVLLVVSLTLRRRAPRWALVSVLVASMFTAAVALREQALPADLAQARNLQLERIEGNLRRVVDRVVADSAEGLDARTWFEHLAGACRGSTDLAVVVLDAGRPAAWCGEAFVPTAPTQSMGAAFFQSPHGPVLAWSARAATGHIVIAQLSIAATRNLVGAAGTPARTLPATPGDPWLQAATTADLLARAVLGMVLWTLAITGPTRWIASLGGLILVAVSRGVLTPPGGIDGALFSPATLALAAPMGLLASPYALLASGVSALVGAVVLARFLASFASDPRPIIGGVLVAIGAAISATLTGVGLGALGRLAANSEIDLADHALVPFEASRLAAVFGLLSATAAMVIVVGALTRRGLSGMANVRAVGWWVGGLIWSGIGLGSLIRWGGATEWPLLPLAISYLLPLLAVWAVEYGAGRPWARIALVGALASGNLCWLSTHAQRTALTRFIEHDLAPTMRRHDADARWLVQSVTTDLGRADTTSAFEGEPEDLAYAVWRRTRLAEAPYRSAVDVQGSDGATARFSYRLPLPPDIRAVNPGAITLQDIHFHGRPLRVLAGAARLASGATVTVRVGEDYSMQPFFPSVHQLREVLVPQRGGHLRPLTRSQAQLAVVDDLGRSLYASRSPAFPVPMSQVNAARASPSPIWWQDQFADRTYVALSFNSEDRVLTVAIPRLQWLDRLALLLHAVLSALVLGVAVLLGATATGHHALPPPSWIGRSYYRKAVLGFAAAAIAPGLASSLYLRSTIEAQKLQEMRQAPLVALELGRRILAEYSAEDPLAPIDDSALIWVSQTIGYDLALFRNDTLAATSARELFREGLLSELPEATAFSSIVYGGAPLHIQEWRIRNLIAFRATASLAPGQLLTLYAVSHSDDIAAAAATRNRGLLLATAALVLVAVAVARLVARQTTSPVQALTAATAQVATGDFDVRLKSDRQDEIRTLVESFNRMAGELRSQRSLLQARADYLHQLVENATTGVVSIDANLLITTANSAARSITGSGLTVGRHIEDVLTAEPWLPVLQLLRTERRAAREIRVERTGGNRTVRAVVVPLPQVEDSGAGTMLLLEDVSDIVKAKKLEAWAEMARRIAHEIKNPLTPIQLAAEHTRRVYYDGRDGFAPVLDACTATILRQVDDLRRIAREFSAYAEGPRPVERRPVQITSWLEETLEPYRTAPPAGVTIELVASDCGVAEIDAARLRRAVINLIENALQAMPDGGRLTVQASRASDDSITVQLDDTGCGIPVELKDRLFDPYFSTKDAGTGLGLANARQVVDDHGGTIELTSEPGRGTSVRLVLPVLSSRPKSAQSEPSQSEPAPGQ